MREGTVICLNSLVQMTRGLGLNRAKLGKIDNHKREPGKLPLPRFIEQLYFEGFGQTTSGHVASIEERCRVEGAQREARRAAWQQPERGQHLLHGERRRG